MEPLDRSVDGWAMMTFRRRLIYSGVSLLATGEALAHAPATTIRLEYGTAVTLQGTRELCDLFPAAGAQRDGIEIE